MFAYEFDHDDFDTYAEEHVFAILNVALVLHKLSYKAFPITELSKMINDSDRISGSKHYNIYAIVDRMVRWGYVVKEKNGRKYNSNLFVCVLTPQGRELLRIIPDYLYKCIILYQKVLKIVTDNKQINGTRIHQNIKE